MAENQIYGTEGNDLLLDTSAQDEIFAFAGNDEIETTSGNDIIYGDVGIDKLTFNRSSDSEDTFFALQNYDNYNGDGYLEISSPNSSEQINYIYFYGIEKLEFFTGRGNDYISTGKGFNAVDGGSGFDVLDLEFGDSSSGVTSRLDSQSQGEYVSEEGVVGFSNIEAVKIHGSSYDDILVGFAVEYNWLYSEMFSTPMIDGGMGFDELVLNYSHRNRDVGVSVSYDHIHVFDNSGSSKSLNFKNIEAINITTGRGDDNIDLGYYNHSDNTINAGGGNDYISTGQSFDIIDGSYGFDVIDGGYGFDVLDLDFGSSSSGITSRLDGRSQGEYVSDEGVVNFSNIEAVNIYGSSYDDILVGFAIEYDWLYSEMFSTPMIDGGMGFDELVLDYSHHNQNLEVSVDYKKIYISVFDNYGSSKSLNFKNIEAVNITTGRGDDNINLGYDNYSDDTINAGGGNDYIYYISTGKGFDVVDGGSGYDFLFLNFTDSTSSVTSDLIDSDSGEYISNEGLVEFSNIEAVEIQGSSYDDVLVAPAGKSNAVGSFVPFVPFVDGNSGFDELVVDYSDNSRHHDVTVNFNIHRNSSINSYGHQNNRNTSIEFNDIESLNITTGRGRNFIDLGLNNYSDDIVNAGGGNDYIFTGKGFDVIDGGSGFDVLNLDFTDSVNGVTSSLSSDRSGEYSDNDYAFETAFDSIEAVNIVASSEDDFLYGLKGQDTIYGELGADTVVGGHGTDFIDGGLGEDSLRGGDDDDILSGGAGVDTIRGETGNDSIDGNEDRDLLFGDEGNDTINGGLGDDLLKGGDENDILIGGEGKDILFGNEGMDIFALESNSDFDIIKDFSNDKDLIGLTNGLSFADLSIVNNSLNSAAIIRNVNENNEVVALVIGVDSTDITINDFTNL